MHAPSFADLMGESRGSDYDTALTIGPQKTLKEVAPALVQCLDENPELLRATPLAQVLKDRGKILDDPFVDENTFKLSESVQLIDAFISHNWTTPRNPKFRSLALFDNWPIACMFSSVTCFLFFIICVQIELPYTKNVGWKHDTENRAVNFKWAPYCLISSTLVFFFTLFFWQDVIVTMGFPSQKVFLDKTCIDQSYSNHKKAGIQNMIGILARSRSMVVVYSDTYLQKLWTVFELTSFLILHKQIRALNSRTLVVMPTFLHRLILLSALVGVGCELYQTIHGWDHEDDFRRYHVDEHDYGFPGSILGYFLMVACGVPLLITLNIWARELSHFEMYVETFNASSAPCHDEADRPLVLASIVGLMRSLDLIPSNASDKRAIESFNRCVRLMVPQCMKGALGRNGIPYRYSVVLMLSLLWSSLDRCAAEMKTGVNYKIGLRVSSAFLTVFVIWPSAVGLAYQATERTMRFGLAMQYMLSVLITIMTVGYLVFILRVQAQLETNAVRAMFHTCNCGIKTWDFGVYFAFGCVQMGMTCKLYRARKVYIPDHNHLAGTLHVKSNADVFLTSGLSSAHGTLSELELHPVSC